MSLDFFSSVFHRFFPPSVDARTACDKTLLPIQSDPLLTTAATPLPPSSSSLVSLPSVPIPHSKESKFNRQAKWYGLGATVTVKGIILESPMVYVGERLPMAGGGDDPSLVDPQCSVDQAASFDINSLGMDCSYRGFSDHQRLAYLHWLAAGRLAAKVPKDFLLVFFYGLERRVVMDSPRFPEARAEWSVIMDELKQLLAIHDRNPGSFQSKALALLNWMELADDPPRIYLDEASRMQTEMRPLRMRFALSQACRDGAPVPGWLALIWIRNDPRVVLRKTALKCPELFGWLFIEKYTTQFARGLLLSRGNVPLEFTYPPASPALQQGEGVVLNFGDMMDATSQPTCLPDLLQVVEDATAGLDGYSRAIGAKMERVGSFEAALSLPVSLWAHAPGVDEAMRQCRMRLNTASWVMTLAEALALFGHEGKQPIREKLRLWAQSLESLGIGLVPDLLVNARPISASDPVVLFQMEMPPETEDRLPASLEFAVLTLEVAMTVALADPDRSLACVHALTKQILQTPGLTSVQLKRLEAHVFYAHRKTPALGALKKRLSTVSLVGCEQIAALALHCVQGDGEITHAQLKALEKAQTALALDEKKLFQNIHTLSTGGIVQVDTGGPAEFTLDTSRIAELNRDTDHIVGVLATIFTENGSTVCEPAMSERRMLGLSEEYIGFARALIARPQWTRAQAEAMARSQSLGLDGALCILNDAAFDVHGIPFTEGDEPIDVNPEILENFR